MSNSPTLRTVNVTRYITPLREGGSLPALVEADDGFMYVLKFRGAGQGIKVLIAELLIGELARALGLRMPELVFCELDEAFGRTEPDEEIQDLLRASTLVTTVEPRLASLVVWLDCLTLNVDRTARNTNMLLWHKELWLIDHGAALYVHHTGPQWVQSATRPFPSVKDHVLLPQATALATADIEGRARLTPEVLASIIAVIPDEWLQEPDLTPAQQRANYQQFLEARLAFSATFTQEADHARQALV
jgi:hypothetical protein